MSVMLIKATHLHSGPLQSVMVGMVVIAAVVDIESVVIMVVFEVVVDGMLVVEAVVVVGNIAPITEETTRWILFLALPLSSIEPHCQSSPLSSTSMSVICPWLLAMMTDPGADSQRTERTKYSTVQLIFTVDISSL